MLTLLKETERMEDSLQEQVSFINMLYLEGMKD